MSLWVTERIRNVTSFYVLISLWLFCILYLFLHFAFFVYFARNMYFMYDLNTLCPLCGKSQNTKNDQFRRKQHIVLWINTVGCVKQYFIYTYVLSVQVSVRQAYNKCSKCSSIDTLLKINRRVGTIDRQPGSGRPRSMCVNENTENVEDLVLSHEDNRKNAPIESWDLMWSWRSLTWLYTE